MRISTVGPLPPAPHDYMPHAKAFGNNYLLIDNVGLNIATVTPTVPSNIRLDDSSNATFINITWDIIEGISPAIMTYEVTYNLSRIDGSIENNRVLKVRSKH